jgi:hypothetical protein
LPVTLCHLIEPLLCRQFILGLWLTIEDHDTLFVLAELAHFVGIVVLVYKLHRKKSVAGVQLVCNGSFHCRSLLTGCAQACH